MGEVESAFLKALASVRCKVLMELVLVKQFCGEFEVMSLVEDEMEQFANMAPKGDWIWLTSIIIIYNSITFVLILNI